MSQVKEFATYYNRAILKRPHWVWQIWLYFWLAGIGAGCSIIGFMAKIFGKHKKVEPLIRAAHYISLGAGITSPVLLILDLGRPERFMHMLRVLKLRSPLSVGTYIMSGFGVTGGLCAARQVVKDGLIPANSLPGKLIGLIPATPVSGVNALFGFGMGTYTGVLLSTTAIPLWHEASEILPPLFFSSSISNASAALQLVLLLGGEEEKSANFRTLETIETAALISELTLLGAGRLKLGDLVSRPLTRGVNGKIFMFGSIGGGMLLPLLLQYLSKKRAVRLLATVLTLVGGFTLRYCIIEGGKLSADDPQAYHSVTRTKV